MNKSLKVASFEELVAPSNGRAFMKITFADPSNPFCPTKTRNVFSEEDGSWKTVSPEIMKGLVGKLVPAEIINTECESYSIVGTDNVERWFNYVTLVKFAHESVDQALRAIGRKPVATEQTVVAEQSATADVSLI